MTYKQLIVGLIVTMSPLYSMEKSEPVATGTMMVLTQDIARKQIQPWLSFQEISRLKRLSKHYNTLYSIESNCSHSKETVCLTYACNRCAKSYYQCTKMLVYFALKHRELSCQKKTANEDALKRIKDTLKCIKQIFRHLWFYHRDIRIIQKRKKAPESIIKGKKCYYQGSDVNMKDAMSFYRHRYKKLENVDRHMFRCARIALEKQNISLANIILSESSLNLFDLSKKICVVDEDIDFMFLDACSLNNTDLIKNMCGGCVDTNSFLYIIRHAKDQLLYNLIAEDILPAESVTKDGKYLLHYAAEYGFENVVTIALAKDAYVNCRDFQKRTPLHYAVEKARLGIVTELLSCADVEVRFEDKDGRTAIDYNVPRRKHLLHAPKRSKKRETIARMLKDHKDQHHVSGYSHSRVHSNGYQALL